MAAMRECLEFFNDLNGRGKHPGLKGALTLQECLGLMAEVKPHVLSRELTIWHSHIQS